jgi:hypothetical protein
MIRLVVAFYVNEVRLCLRTVAINGPICHLPHDIRVWSTVPVPYDAMVLEEPLPPYEYEVPWRNDIDRKTKRLREKPVPVPLCPQQIPYGLIWA